MNPISVFKRLVANTIFNSGASMFLQGIAGHRQDNDANRLRKNLKHIQKEAQEGIDAIDAYLANGARASDQDTVKAVRDAYADVRVLLDGAGQMANFPFEADYKAVLASLITRFDPTMEDAEKTREKYLSKFGVLTRIHEDKETGMFVNIVESHLTPYITDELLAEYPVGKWLKSYKYQEPQLEDSRTLINLECK